MGTLPVGAENFTVIDLPAHCGEKLARLPWVMRLLLENVLRCAPGPEGQAGAAALLEWLETGSSEVEIPFQPSRVLMHDTTSTPALVDIAAMRDELAEAGVDPTVLRPQLPVDVSVDHSLAVEVFGQPGAIAANMQHEIRRNAERYRFLRWASRALPGVHVHAPGTGIMHTMNLEQLATVVTTEEREGRAWLVPDTMIGTDSHTPMVNGIGVLGWGVGGLEAQTVMFGLPTMLKIPDVVGVRLVGALRPGVLATDLALVVTQRLRQLDVTGDFVEFFGPGVGTLAAGERSVIANMAPEYGATTGYFPVDGQTLRYLRETGRKEEAVERVEAYARRVGIWFDPDADPRYTRSIEIDLATVDMHVAGPRRPQDLQRYSELRELLGREALPPQPGTGGLPDFPVAIAAITSCTNTSDPGLLIAAGLVARKARARGLTPPHWVKTSLAPGSPAALAYLERSGLLPDLEAMGFGIVGYGCTTCIGNPGPLTGPVRQAQDGGSSRAVAILSGNRNFPGRVHPDIDLSFIMSPPLAVALGLAGDARRNLETEPVQHAADGTPVFLRELWPTREEVRGHLERSQDPADYQREFARAAGNPLWLGLKAPEGPRFPWDPKSTALRRPPFASRKAGSLLGRYTAHPLLVLGDDITTDHISPASAIPPDSFVADFLVERGERREDLNVFASRRGNWEVMVRAAFFNKSMRNLLAPQAPVGHTLHVPSGEVLPVWQAAQRYQDAGDAVVVLAGERYGMGSSRDWAAKGQRLLGIRAVVAVSFERIHRSNLIGMGILPLLLPAGVTPQSLDVQPGDRIEVQALPQDIAPRAPVKVTVVRSSGQKLELLARAAVETQLEASLLREGGVLPAILHRTLEAQPA
ncbi:aconitate hydratase [Ramlibacter sp. Leaf400]|nr:aconitate hydratase [Ramlibacter sp. Leaf400]